MRTIALVLDDNDFGSTFKPLLESIHKAIDWNQGLSEEVVKHAVMAGIEFHYVAYQLGMNYGQPGYGTVADTVDYLRKVTVLFDEEAEADILKGGHDGGAWYLEVPSGIVSSY